MYVENGWPSLDPIHLSLLHPHECSDNCSEMDGFQDGGYICAQGVLRYHLIKVLWTEQNHVLKVLYLRV